MPSGEVDNMAQIVLIEPSNKWCRNLLIAGYQTFVCLQVVSFIINKTGNLYKSIIIKLPAYSGEQYVSGQKPNPPHPTLHNSIIIIQPTFVVGQKSFVARFHSQFGHCQEKGLSFGIPNQWLFEGRWAMLGKDNHLDEYQAASTTHMLQY